MMEDRKKIQSILNQAHPQMRRHLDVDEALLVELKATQPEVITDEEHDEIIHDKKTRHAKVDYLVNKLKLKSLEVFVNFMGELEKKDKDLYNHVKGFQDREFAGMMTGFFNCNKPICFLGLKCDYNGSIAVTTEQTSLTKYVSITNYVLIAFLRIVHNIMQYETLKYYAS